MLIFCTMLTFVTGAKTPAGAAGQVRTRMRFSAEEAHRPPRGKRSAWNGNQHSLLTVPFDKNIAITPVSPKEKYGKTMIHKQNKFGHLY